jgi:hypothetical protein
MRLPENALNIPNLALVKMETAALLTPTKLWTRSEVLARPWPSASVSWGLRMARRINLVKTRWARKDETRGDVKKSVHRPTSLNEIMNDEFRQWEHLLRVAA